MLATPRAEQHISTQVTDIVRLLMQRPITEAIALRVQNTPGFEHLEIVGGEWVGFDKDEYTVGKAGRYSKEITRVSNSWGGASVACLP